MLQKLRNVPPRIWLAIGAVLVVATPFVFSPAEFGYAVGAYAAAIAVWAGFITDRAAKRAEHWDRWDRAGEAFRAVWPLYFEIVFQRKQLTHDERLAHYQAIDEALGRSGGLQMPKTEKLREVIITRGDEGPGVLTPFATDALGELADVRELHRDEPF